jgi:hypothetical protein
MDIVYTLLSPDKMALLFIIFFLETPGIQANPI